MPSNVARGELDTLAERVVQGYETALGSVSRTALMSAVASTPRASGNPSYLGVRHDMLTLVPPAFAGRVLDIGCAAGATGAALKSQYLGSEVTGIERDPEVAERAASQLDRVLVGDAAEMLLGLERDSADHFDLVLCGDVLEHLVDPWATLKIVRRLCPTGYLIVSLPNVAHMSTIAALLRSHWPYRERGIHDRTHLRFFARNNLPELYGSAGFQEVRRLTRYRLLERPSPLNPRLEPWLARLPIVRRLTEYQFISLLK